MRGVNGLNSSWKVRSYSCKTGDREKQWLRGQAIEKKQALYEVNV